MSNEPFFKSQADIQRWLLEEVGRKVTYNDSVVGYNCNNELWLYSGDIYQHKYYGGFDGATRWQPVPATVPPGVTEIKAHAENETTEGNEDER